MKTKSFPNAHLLNAYTNLLKKQRAMIGNQVKEMAIRQFMTTELHTVKPDSTMKAVEDLFLTHRIHHIPVVDGTGELVGILGRKEYYILLDQFSLFRQKNVESVNEKFFNSILVKEVMKKNPISISLDATVKEAYAVFRENLVHALPVTDNKNKLVGILTTMDLLRLAYGEETHLLDQPGQ